jgi:NADH-quinone oxidoreductase subunit M
MAAPTHHLLSWVIFLPLLGSAALLLLPRRVNALAKAGALIIALGDFLLSLRLLSGFHADASFQFKELVPWVPQLGISYSIAIDGISLWLVLLTTFLGPVVILSTWNAVQERVREFMIDLLLLQAAMLGTFCARDMILFYVFWEAMLIPMALIIGIWGGPRRIYAAVKFFLYTMVGSVLMLVAILYMYGRTGGSFAMADFAALKLTAPEQLWLFGAFALAFAIKVPVWPLHTWLPDAHVEAPTAGSVMLAAVLLKMGTYGLLRLAIPMFPLAVARCAPLMAALGVIGIIFGALVAMVQRDIKKLVAYSSVSHLGFVVLGLFALSTEAIAGGVVIMLAHGLATGALFLLVGVLYERRHTREIAEFGGLAHVMPRYATVFMIVTLASIGLPGLSGFVGEFLVLLGTFKSGTLAGAAWLTALGATGVILGAVYMLWMVQRVFFGPCSKEQNQRLPDLSLREAAVLLPLVVMIFWLGLFPKPWLSRMEPAIAGVVTAHAERVAQARAQSRFAAAGGAAGAPMAVPAVAPAVAVAPASAQESAQRLAAAPAEVVR